MNPSVTVAALVDLVLALSLLEGAALVVLHRATGRGIAPRDFLLNLLAGMFLMLALRCQVRELGAAWVAVCLAAAGVAHAGDLWMRRGRVARPADSKLRELA